MNTTEIFAGWCQNNINQVPFQTFCNQTVLVISEKTGAKLEHNDFKFFVESKKSNCVKLIINDFQIKFPELTMNEIINALIESSYKG